MTELSSAHFKLPKLRAETQKADIKRLRAAGMKLGAFACYMPKRKCWVLLKISSEERPFPGPSSDWIYPPMHICHAQFAIEDKIVCAKRRKGTGKGKRPYPRAKRVVQMAFKSERQAYIVFLMRGDELKWIRQ